MQHSIKKILFFTILGMFLFSFPVYLVASDTTEDSPLLSPESGENHVEPFGQLIFLGCLAYVVAYRFFQNERDLITIANELETARQIQSFILPRKTVDINDIYLAAHYVPMASVADYKNS